ncbi:hypothetical protein FKW77_007364 [Venturia effusa]|uniref:BZIP domain-containing protein n=1 Tax=Venturia effusa TaxID=50376 RepID=A0A517KZR3_9PEZI|nr:hypothetical protein FKW77_007364 [Venturia effusa]
MSNLPTLSKHAANASSPQPAIGPASPTESVAPSAPSRGSSLAPTVSQGLSLRPSTTLAPSATAPNVISPMSSGLSTGPMTSSIAVPARPKPGRKAATDEPDNKRKAQNRAAQRAFRERKTNVQRDLESQNNDLRARNDQLAAEREHDRNRMAALEQQLASAQARESQVNMKWENALKRMASLQQQKEDAESRENDALSLARQRQDDVERMTMELNTYKARLSQANFLTKSKHLSRPQAPNHFVNQVLPQKRQFDNGCGDCQQDGTCPCVDDLVQDPDTEIGPDGMPPLNRNMSTASMSITNLLSPPDSTRNNSHSEAPDLTSDQGSSPEEMEIDFTNQFAKMQPNTHIQNSDGCGLCSDDSICFCRDAEATLETVKPMPQPAKIMPGTCEQCQLDPEQKAYCEGLALQTKVARELVDGQPDPKRTRIQGRGQDITMGCADAFAVYKQVSSRPGRQASFEDVYKTFMNSGPPSRRGTEAFISDAEIKPRQFSAYETNIAAVLTTLGKDFRKNSMADWITTREIEELLRPQPQMMDIKDIGRLSTAPRSGGSGPSLGTHHDAGCAPSFSSDSRHGSANAWQSWVSATPGIFATQSHFPPPPHPTGASAGHDLARYSLSIPDSAP